MIPQQPASCLVSKTVFLFLLGSKMSSFTHKTWQYLNWQKPIFTTWFMQNSEKLQNRLPPCFMFELDIFEAKRKRKTVMETRHEAGCCGIINFFVL